MIGWLVLGVLLVAAYAIGHHEGHKAGWKDGHADGLMEAARLVAQ